MPSGWTSTLHETTCRSFPPEVGRHVGTSGRGALASARPDRLEPSRAGDAAVSAGPGRLGLAEALAGWRSAAGRPVRVDVGAGPTAGPGRGRPRGRRPRRDPPAGRSRSGSTPTRARGIGTRDANGARRSAGSTERPTIIAENDVHAAAPSERNPAPSHVAAGPLRHRRPRPGGRRVPRLPGRDRPALVADAAGRADRLRALAVPVAPPRSPATAADQPRAAGGRRPLDPRRLGRLPRAARRPGRLRRRRSTPRTALLQLAFDRFRPATTGSRSSGTGAGALADRLLALHGPQGRHDGKALGRLGPRHRRPRARRPWRSGASELARTRSASTSSSSTSSTASGPASASTAGARNIGLIGDLPIFVSHDSADVWARPELFQLDEPGRPTHVAGVPPDYFSEDGQLWGNPLYRWPAHADEQFAWWVDRVRGDARPGRPASGSTTSAASRRTGRSPPTPQNAADRGDWALGPGGGAAPGVRDACGGGLPLIAEDLGVITFEVEALRDEFELPGMRVLQFAFGDDPLADGLPAAQLHPPLHRLHRDPRQRHDPRLVHRPAGGHDADPRGAGGRAPVHPPLRRDRRLGGPLGPDPRRLRLGRRHGDLPVAGRARAWAPRPG